MGEVKCSTCKGMGRLSFENGAMVQPCLTCNGSGSDYAKSFDAAQSELARVQKISDNYYALCVEGNQQLAALREELAERKRKHLRSCQIAIGKSQLAKELRSELTAAEQRNVALTKHLTQAHKFVEATYGAADSGVLQAGQDASTIWNIDESKVALKPTESGASE